MIQLQGAGKRFGHKLLFDDCNWLITPKERTGLVGGNGTGKSTLLKVLCGMESLDYGEVTFAKGISQGYLPQDGLSLTGRTVFAECMAVFQDLRDMERELESLHHKLAELDPAGPEYAAASDRLHHIESEFPHHDGYALEARVGAALNGLGFKRGLRRVLVLLSYKKSFLPLTSLVLYLTLGGYLFLWLRLFERRKGIG